MKVQVFAVKSIQEMQMCIDAGLDRWGLEVGKKGIMPSEMSFEKTRGSLQPHPPIIQRWLCLSRQTLKRWWKS